MTGTALTLPVRTIGWDLRGALATRRHVRLILSDRCDGIRPNADGERVLHGRVQRVAATDAYCVVQGRHVPLSDVLAVHRPHFTQAQASDPEADRG